MPFPLVRSLSLSAVVLACPIAHAQNVGSNCDTWLRSQEEVDAFDCTSITELRIAEFSGTAITDLSPLAELVTIAGDLDIGGNSSLTSLAGLSGLETVGGSVFVSGNDQLPNLTGLSSLETVGSLNIQSNPNLQDLSGLSSLTSVTGDLALVFGNALVSLNGLDQLELVGGRLIIQSGNFLTSLDGLSDLREVGGTLDIFGNPVLANVDALSGLVSAGGVNIQSNPVLTDVDGLSGLEVVDGFLLISTNALLEDLDGLRNLISVAAGPSTTGLLITRNEVLDECAVGLGPILSRDNVENPDPIGGSVNISLNGPTFNGGVIGADCSSPEATLAAFEALPSALPIANAAVDAGSCAGGLPAGLGTCLLSVTGTHTAAVSQRYTVFLRLSDGAGYSRVAFRGEVKPQAGQTITQSIRLKTKRVDPLGPLTLDVLAELGSVPSPSGEAAVIASTDLVKGEIVIDLGEFQRVAEPLSVFPNPATDAATLRFAVEEAGAATLVVYDALGRVVARPVDGVVEGAMEVPLDVAGLPAGLYVARLVTATRTETVRLTVAR